MAEKMRIYVGGLGASVQEDDLRKTFSLPHLGTVDSVEIIRSKGRSFAYLDFVPASDKGLAKLFSAYNGCMWRGSKLKLEKAKEHYFLRLKREWAEDAKLTTILAGQNVDGDETIHTSLKSKDDVNKMQLNIFFPRLRKIKSLPLKGTGKHKYSFQRVEVPPLPVHFCDCEEHSGTPEFSAKTNYADETETEIGGVNEEELNMMKSVLDKLFEKENKSQKPSDNADCVEERKTSIAEADDLDDGENGEDYVSDDDNLVINVVTKPNNRSVLFEDRGQKRSSDQNTLLVGSESSIGGSGSQKTNRSNKKRKVSAHENEPEKENRASDNESERRQHNTDETEPPKSRENGPNDMPSKRNAKKGAAHDNMHHPKSPAPLNRNALHSRKSEWRNLVCEKGSSGFHISDIYADRIHEHEVKSQTEPSAIEKDNQEHSLTEDKEPEKGLHVKSTEPSALEVKPTSGALWSQKASWLQLVGNTNSSSFSLAQVIPGLASEIKESQESSAKDFANLKVGNLRGFALRNDKSSNGNLNGSSPSSNVNASVKEVYCAVVDGEQQNSDANQNIEQEASVSVPGSSEAPSYSRPGGEIVISETCPFMRSAASVKEWTKIKTALSSSLKKKGKGKEPVQN